MKHTFAKKALLLGAATIFLNTVPVHAMSDMGVPTPSAIKAQVAQKARQFGKWAQDQAGRLSLERRLNSAMKFLDKQFKNVMKCLRGEGCTRGQIVAITATLATIMAIVTTLGAYKVGKIRGYKKGKKEAAVMIPAMTRQAYEGGLKRGLRVARPVQYLSPEVEGE